MLRDTAVNIRLTRPAVVQDGPRHVIAEYKHRAQTVTCECGWHGSTASAPRERSAWQDHVAEHRPART
jgi:hypothetical protein